MKQLINKIIRKIMMNSAYKERNAKGFESDHFIEEEIKNLCIKHQINLIIELGSQFGATANRLSQFANVIGCEIDKETYNEAKENLASRVLLFNCSSEQLLETNLKNILDRKVLIYIDSHTWQMPTPLLRELELIALSGLKPVICIHDFKVPGRPELGFDSYFGQDYELEWILPSIQKIYKEGYDYHYNKEAAGAMRGIVYIEPIIKEGINKTETFNERLEAVSEKIINKKVTLPIQSTKADSSVKKAKERKKESKPRVRRTKAEIEASKKK